MRERLARRPHEGSGSGRAQLQEVPDLPPNVREFMPAAPASALLPAAGERDPVDDKI